MQKFWTNINTNARVLKIRLVSGTTSLNKVVLSYIQEY